MIESMQKASLLTKTKRLYKLQYTCMARNIKYTIKVDTNVTNVKKDIQDSLDKMKAKVNVTAEINKVEKPKEKVKIDAEINPTSKQGLDKSAQRSGSDFGKSFANFAVISALSSSAWQGLSGLMNFSLGSYNLAREASMSRTLLTNSLAFRTRQARDTRATLGTEGNYDAKAFALGIDLSKSQKEVGASAGKTNTELDRQRRIVDSLTNSHQDQIDTLDIALRQKERQLETLKKTNEEEVRTQQRMRGLAGFTQESEKLAQEISRLSIHQMSLEISGENTLELDEQIGKLKQQKDLQDENIDLIGMQVKGYEDAAEALENDLLTQIRIIRAEIEDRRLQMDIDVAPAQRSLDKLRENLSNLGSVGGGVSSPGITDSMKNFLDNALIKDAPTQESVDASLAKLYSKYEGYIAKSTIDVAFTDLILSGLNADQATDLFQNLTDAAAGTPGGVLTMTQKLNALTEAYRLNNSRLSQGKGLNEDFISQIIPKGTKLLIQQALAVGDNETALRLQNGQLTEAEENMAKFEGTMFYTTDTMGSFASNTDKMGLDRLAVQADEARIGIGNSLTPIINEAASAISNLLQPLTKFITDNPELVSGVFQGLTGGMGIAVIAGSIAAVIGLIALASWPIIATIAGIIAVAAMIGGVFAILGANWEEHGGPIKEELELTKAEAKKLWEMFSTSPEYHDLIKGLKEIGHILVDVIFWGLKESIIATRQFYELLIKAGEAWEGMKRREKSHRTAREHDPLFRAGLPGMTGDQAQIVAATGGYVDGPGTGTSDSIPARLSAGEFVIRADAVRMLGRSTMEMINNVATNTTNTLNNYTTRNTEDYVQI